MPNRWQWLDAQPHLLTPQDRALAFGDGCFETIRWHQGRAPLQSYHHQRLVHSLERLLLPPLADDFWFRLAQRLPQTGTYRVKVIFSRGKNQRGYGLPQVPQPWIDVDFSPLEITRPGGPLLLLNTRWSPDPLLAGMKHLNRLPQVLARAELQNLQHQGDYYEGLVLSTAGLVVSATQSNVFWSDGHKIYTPSVQNLGIAGVCRAASLDILTRSGWTVEVADFPQDALDAAQSMWLTNGVLGWQGITHWQGRPLQQDFHQQLWRGVQQQCAWY